MENRSLANESFDFAHTTPADARLTMSDRPRLSQTKWRHSSSFLHPDYQLTIGKKSAQHADSWRIRSSDRNSRYFPAKRKCAAAIDSAACFATITVKPHETDVV